MDLSRINASFLQRPASGAPQRRREPTAQPARRITHHAGAWQRNGVPAIVHWRLPDG